MANFTEDQIQAMIKMLKDEFNPDIATRELAVLELEDLWRKGCVLDMFDNCHSCTKTLNCPVLTWEKRHPEYANDELAMKIKILEAGGEEAYKEKLKRQEELRAEELKKKAEQLDCTELKQKLFDILDDYFINDKYASEAGPLADIVLLIDYAYDRER